MKKISPLIILIFALLLTGQSCNNIVQGDIYRSVDLAENWEESSFIGVDGKKIVTIAGADIKQLIFEPVFEEIIEEEEITEEINEEEITKDNATEETETTEEEVMEEEIKSSPVIYATTYNSGVYKTIDNGQSWQQTSLNSGYFRDLAIDPKNPQIIYAATENNVYQSIDGGQGWENIYTDTKGGQIMKILINHYNSQHLYALTSSDTIITSYDYGVNWSIIYETEDYPIDAFMSSYDSRVIYILDKQGLLYSTGDSGNNWTIHNKDNKEYKKSFPKAGNITSFGVDPSNYNIIYTASKQGLLKSTDGGQSWQQINILIPNQSDENVAIKNITISPDNSEIIYFTINNLIHKTIDGGRSWKTIENFPSSKLINEFVIDPENYDILYAGVRNPPEEKNSPFGI